MMAISGGSFAAISTPAFSQEIRIEFFYAFLRLKSDEFTALVHNNAL